MESSTIATHSSYEPGKKYCGRVKEIKFLPLTSIERQEMDFRPEVMTVSQETAAAMIYSEPIEVTAFRFGKANDDTLPVVTLKDGHHRVAAAIQTGRKYLPVIVSAINARGEKLNALIAISTQLEKEWLNGIAEPSLTPAPLTTDLDTVAKHTRSERPPHDV